MGNQRQRNQMNRPNNMFDMVAFNQNQQRTNSFNQIDGQRMQYRMDTNQRNPMTQMTQLNQRNQFDNRRFKRDAESDFVSYRTMTETPTQRSHTEVHRYTEPQHIQLVQGSYTHGYTVPTFQGPFNQGFPLFTAPPPDEASLHDLLGNDDTQDK